MRKLLMVVVVLAVIALLAGFLMFGNPNLGH